MANNLHNNMKAKLQINSTPSFKLLLFGCCFLLFILILFTIAARSTPSLAQTQTQSTPHSCTKIPPSLADTILHYATSNTTPQQTLDEIAVTARVLARRSPCNFLVFGLGLDSLMWSALNHGGRTVFLEEDGVWMETTRKQFPLLESYHVRYDTKVTEAEELLQAARRLECTAVDDVVRNSECRLALKGLPRAVKETEWDVVMVDAPTGWRPEAPGRMGAIYTAGMAARGKKEGETDVLVHDVDRTVEDKFSMELLCEGYLKEEQGRLRHFTIPSHHRSSNNNGSSITMPFCP